MRQGTRRRGKGSFEADSVFAPRPGGSTTLPPPHWRNLSEGPEELETAELSGPAPRGPGMSDELPVINPVKPDDAAVSPAAPQEEKDA